MGRSIEDELGQELRESRPTPSDEYVASVAGSVNGPRRVRGAGRRLVVAAVVSAIAVVALAATGGMSQASSAPQSVSKIVKTAFKSKPAKVNTVSKSAAKDQYGEKEKCNSGRGNLSEGSDAKLKNPHEGATGPGNPPTVDCDPGNSGPKNHGGD